MKETLYDALYDKYPQNGLIGVKWEEATNTDFEWESISKANLAKFADYLCSTMAKNSARQYCAKLKAVMELHSDTHDFPTGWRKLLSIKDDESQQIYLTEDEIKRLIVYHPRTETEAIVLQQFILGCLTGARHSDYSRFTTANVQSATTLVYVSQKTHIKAELPLSPIAKGILFGGVGDFVGAYKKKVSDHTFNDTIRDICKRSDITQEIQLYRHGKFWIGEKYKAVSSHTSRRSFCTNLYLRCRDLYLVSKLAGHSDTKMTERYICCATEALTQQALDYFNEFS